MARTKEPKVDEQGYLLDVGPENAKTIKRHARAYKRAQKARLKALAEEIKHKVKIVEAVKAANLSMVDGAYKLRVDGMLITVTPRDESVKVKEDGGDESGGE